MKRILLLSCIVLMSACKGPIEQPKVVAHRGYWQVLNSAQNSIASLEQAHANRAYGTEFDVHLTWDNVLVLYHDNTVGGRKIQDMTYDELRGVRLRNGEAIPRLEDFLKRAKMLDGIQLFLELKAHNTVSRDRKAAQLCVDAVKAVELENRTDFISFSLPACREFIRQLPGGRVYYLKGDLTPEELGQRGFYGMNYSMAKMRQNPHWFQQARELGLKIGVWTVNDDNDIREMIDYRVDMITTDNPELVFEIINSYKPNYKD